MERAAENVALKKAEITRSFLEKKRELLQELAQQQQAAEKIALEDMQRAKARLERVVVDASGVIACI